MSLLEQFRKLHKQKKPLLLANVWDAHSIQLAEKAGFQALGSSSHAIANMLGYPDGEEIPVDELMFMIDRMIRAAGIPLSVDFEAGYSGDPERVATYVKTLVGKGVVGINLEDGVVKNGKRTLGDAAVMVEKIKAITSTTKVFINARVDTYTTKHNHALAESIQRANLYKEAGASGVFVPLMESESDIKEFVSQVNLPLNVFATSTLPSYDRLTTLGVKRISHGGNYYDMMVAETDKFFKTLKKENDFSIFK